MVLKVKVTGSQSAKTYRRRSRGRREFAPPSSYYRQDCPKGSSAGIIFTHRLIFRFFAPQGRHVAPIKVKFGRPVSKIPAGLPEGQLCRYFTHGPAVFILSSLPNFTLISSGVKVKVNVDLYSASS